MNNPTLKPKQAKNSSDDRLQHHKLIQNYFHLFENVNKKINCILLIQKSKQEAFDQNFKKMKSKGYEILPQKLKGSNSRAEEQL